MAFYNLSKEERARVVTSISNQVLAELKTSELNEMVAYFGDDDTYIRKSAYLAVGKIYFAHKVTAR